MKSIDEIIEFSFGSFQPNDDGLYDLYLIHQEKVRTGKLSLHPHRCIPKRVLAWLLMRTDLLNEKEACYIVIGGNKVDHRNKFSTVKKLHKNRKRHNYYLATRNIAIKYGHSVPEKSNIELAIQDKMWEENRMLRLEVPTNVGRIDCLSNEELIEVKRASSWKHGLGQLMAYSHGYKNHKKILHLFDYQNRDKLLSTIVPICETLGVEVRFEFVG